MKKTLTIDPVTRISGFMEITTEVEDNIVANAKTSGLLFRGFEKMLKGRSPLDAIYFTQRICGICSTSHAVASSLALQVALNISMDTNDTYLRDLIHGFEFLSNHLRQFYLFTIPDFVKMPDINPVSPQKYTDYRIPDNFSQVIINHYLESINFSRLAHEGVAVLGGKAPHNHGIFAGGVTVNIDSYKLSKIKSILSELSNFINSAMTEDIKILAEYYPDYFEKGSSYNNFMSYGLFNYYNDKDLFYVNPGVLLQDKKLPLNSSLITENIKYSWFVDNDNPSALEKSKNSITYKPGTEKNEAIDIKKPEAYTFIKAPRYDGVPMEVGPLARLMLTGEYTRGNSCMDRNSARVMETKKIAGIMVNIADKLQLKPNNQKILDIPEKGFGMGLVDTIRGALGHWLQIENRVIKNYNIITPSMWNFSPLDENGFHGAAEKALIGTAIKDIDNPVELGRIVRSFDPCISCATHIIGKYDKAIY